MKHHNTCLLLSLCCSLLSCKPATETTTPSPSSNDSTLKQVGVESVSSSDLSEASRRKAQEAPSKAAKTEAKAVSKPTEASSLGYEIVEDLDSIRVEAGAPSPKIGDRIYTMSTLPADQCGEFWVKSPDGLVGRIAVCTGDHEGGH